MPSSKERQGREVIFEFASIGASVKVVAIDVATGIEVSLIGPANAPQRELERIAVQKLLHRLGIEAAPKPGNPDGKSGGDAGGGILV